MSLPQKEHNDSVTNYEKALSRLALQFGLGLRAGDLLLIRAEPANRRMVHRVAALAYDLGARFVRVDYEDHNLARLRIDHSQPDYLGELPEAIKKDPIALSQETWSLLRLYGPDDPHAMEGADAAKIGIARKAAAAASEPLQKELINHARPWCIVPVPTPGWARVIDGVADGASDADVVAQLWGILAPILFLDVPDPVAAHLRKRAILESRKAVLESMQLRQVHFVGPGTDLRVGVSPRSRWCGAGAVTKDGRAFAPNIPTEEVFTTPDARKVEGRLKCTRPVEVHGVQVEGAWLEFEQGAAVRSGAAKNADALKSFLAIDQGARSLGELALVDCSSAIWTSGRVFHSILLDENATCHVALGSAYPDGFEGADAMSETEKAQEGFNSSLVHLDFMIGSDKVDVTGLTSEGAHVDIIRAGKFVIDA